MVDQHRLQILERGLTSRLLIWGIGGTVVGSALWVAGGRSGHREMLRFGRQTALWGATDAVIALAGIRDRRRRGELSDAEVHAKARRLRTLLLVNAAADVVYVAGGVRVLSRTIGGASTSQDDSSAGHGRTYLGMGAGDGLAIVIQGGFLLALDTVYALRVRRARD